MENGNVINVIVLAITKIINKNCIIVEHVADVDVVVVAKLFALRFWRLLQFQFQFHFHFAVYSFSDRQQQRRQRQRRRRRRRPQSCTQSTSYVVVVVLPVACCNNSWKIITRATTIAAAANNFNSEIILKYLQFVVALLYY